MHDALCDLSRADFARLERARAVLLEAERAVAVLERAAESPSLVAALNTASSACAQLGDDLGSDTATYLQREHDERGYADENHEHRYRAAITAAL